MGCVVVNAERGQTSLALRWGRLRFTRRQAVWHPIDARLIADQQRMEASFYLEAGLLTQWLEVVATFDAEFPMVA